MAGGSEQGLRQRKQAATALAIERSAVALVLDHGLDAVTVDMICAASGVSQRTFFNYYKTKDAAILGAAPGTLDERRVREFLVSDSPDVLEELLGLLATLVPVNADTRELVAPRIRIISQSPALMQKEMERLSGVHDEVAEILYLRMRRAAPADEPAEETRRQSALIAHLVPGILRFSLEQGNNDAPGAISRLLADALGKLLPAPSPGASDTGGAGAPPR
ncbi:TetR/AcrR family transcriptional regulator [Arthrobacter antioxidans]|uniref:TetR/AcrR family transcriptional regulator n=1 Tax=Arthrobacter antioxidans TaxID=2895818 RepID=UPI001FFFFE7E|nr:TetR/AcrR family transcriptional regulator [Arthrobacter antioxidans]